MDKPKGLKLSIGRWRRIRGREFKVVSGCRRSCDGCGKKANWKISACGMSVLFSSRVERIEQRSKEK